MERKKIEQIVVVVLAPTFLTALLYMLSSNKGVGKAAVPEAKVLEDKRIDNIPKPAAAQDIKYEAGSKDAIKDILAVYLSTLKKEPKPLDRTPLPKLDISGLIWDTDTPQAIINGKVVRLGDTVEGVKIIKIDKNGVTVECGGEVVFISKKIRLRAAQGRDSQKSFFIKNERR